MTERETDNKKSHTRFALVDENKGKIADGITTGRHDDEGDVEGKQKLWDDEPESAVLEIKNSYRKIESEKPELKAMVKEVVAMVELVKPMDPEDSKGKWGDPKRMGQKMAEAKVEGVVWATIESLDNPDILTEVTEKMAYIEKNDPNNPEAQVRGLNFEMLSHMVSPDDPRVLVTYGPETTDEDTPQNREKTQKALEGLGSVPLESYKLPSEHSNKKEKAEKGVLIGKKIRSAVKDLVELPSLSGQMRMVNAADIRDSKSVIGNEAFYVYLPKPDGDTDSKLPRACIERGVPYYFFNPGEGWRLILPDKWSNRFADTPEGKAERLRIAKNLFAVEYYVRKLNQKFSEKMVVPDGLLLNEDEVPVGLVETKCWYSDEIENAIDRTRDDKSLMMHEALEKKYNDDRENLSLDEAVLREREVNREERLNNLTADQKKALRSMNLTVKIAEEVEYMKAAGVNIKNPKVLLRVPADVNPGQAEELVRALAEKNIDVYVQIMPITADQVGMLATSLMHSEMMIEKLENRYMEKKRSNDKKGMEIALKARCLSLKRGFDELSRADEPGKEEAHIHRLWEEIQDFKTTFKKQKK